jgi:hypothetical protein
MAITTMVHVRAERELTLSCSGNATPFFYGMALFTPYILIRSIQKSRLPLPLLFLTLNVEP